MDIAAVVADALLPAEGERGLEASGLDASLAHLQQLTRETLRGSLAARGLEGLEGVLWEGLGGLKREDTASV